MYVHQSFVLTIMACSGVSSRDTVKDHIQERHADADVTPQMVLLPRRTDGYGERRRSDYYDRVAGPSAPPQMETPSADTASLPAQFDGEDAWADRSLDAAGLDAESPHEDLKEASSSSSSSAYSHYNPRHSLLPAAPSQSVFPERERVPPYARHSHSQGPCFSASQSRAAECSALAPLPKKKRIKLTAPKRADDGRSSKTAVAQPRPRDFYSVHLSGGVNVFRCLQCQYIRSAAKGNLSVQAAIIFHVRRRHMDKRKYCWRCSLCDLRNLKQ